MFKIGKEYVSVTLSEDILKIAHLKGSGFEKRLIGITKRNVQGVEDKDLPGVIQSALGDLRIKKLPVICTIHSNVVMTKNIEIPSLDSEEIKSIIDLQAGRHTPYSREEILVEYISIGTFQRNYTRVLLIIVNRDVIKKQLSVFEGAGVKVRKILFGPEVISCFYAKFLGRSDDDIPVGIIDISGQTSDFIIEFNKTVVASRNIPLGASHLYRDGDKARDKLVGEIMNSVEAYQNEDIARLPETYILTRGDTNIRGLQPILKEKLKAEIRIMPCLDHVKAADPVRLKLTSEYRDESFLNVIAAAASVNTAHVDLIPEDIKTQTSIEEKGKELIKVGAFSTLIFFLICAIFFGKIYFKSIFLDKLEKKYSESRAAIAGLDRVAQKTRIIKGYLNSRLLSLDVIDEIYAKTPDEIYLQSISFDDGGRINVQGTSESMSRVFDYVTYLEDSGLFKNVKTKSTSARKERGKDVAVFNIDFKLESAMDEEDASGGTENQQE